MISRSEFTKLVLEDKIRVVQSDTHSRVSQLFHASDGMAYSFDHDWSSFDEDPAATELARQTLALYITELADDFTLELALNPQLLTRIFSDD